MAESVEVIPYCQADDKTHDNAKEKRRDHPKEERSSPAEKMQKIEDDDEEVVEKEESIKDLCSWLRDFYPNGCSDEKDLLFKYFREMSDSKGFDISNMPTNQYYWLPLTKLEIEGRRNDKIDYHAECAINHYNDRKGTNYKFVKLDKANSQGWDTGVNFYITFQADDDWDAQTFQALVWWGLGPEEICSVVKFCHIRPRSSATKST